MPQQGHFRRQTHRWQTHDYAGDGIYFITIKAIDNTPFFGHLIHPSERNDLHDSPMKLSPIGELALACWEQIPSFHPYVQLDTFIVMPDHMHGILGVYKTDWNIAVGGTALGGSTQSVASLPAVNVNRFGPQRQNLASIVRGFKTGITMAARNIHPGFAWQPRYHDVVIRNEMQLEQTRDYILRNPFQ